VGRRQPVWKKVEKEAGADLSRRDVCSRCRRRTQNGG